MDGAGKVAAQGDAARTTEPVALPRAVGEGSAAAADLTAARALVWEAVHSEVWLSALFLAVGFGAVVLVSVLLTPVATVILARFLDDPELAASTGPSPLVAFLVSLAGFLGALFLVERARPAPVVGTETSDARLRGLADERAKIARTFAPASVCVSLRGDVQLDDRLPLFGQLARRVLVVRADYLTPDNEEALVAELDAQFAAFAGTGRLGASVRARASLLSTSLTNWTSPATEDAPTRVLFRAIEVLARLPAWLATRPLRGPLERATTARRAATAAYAAALGRTRRPNAALLADFERSVLRPLTSIGVFVRDPLVGLQAGSSATPLHPVGITQARGPDGLAEAHAATVDHVIRGDLVGLSCAELVQPKLEPILRVHADLVAARLSVRRRGPGGAAKAFVSLTRSLARGRGPECVGRLQAAVHTDVSVFAGARYNHTLSRALQTTLAVALLDAGGELADPLAARTVAVRLGDEQVDIHQLVNAALARASGAAALERWADRLRNAARTGGERPVSAARGRQARALGEESEVEVEVMSASGAPPAAARTTEPDDVDPRRGSAETSANERQLRAANTRLTGHAVLLLALFGLLAAAAVLPAYLVVGAVWSEVLEEDEPPQAPPSEEHRWILGTLFVAAAVVSTSGRLKPRASVDRTIPRRVTALIDAAAARHATYAPAPEAVAVVEEQPGLPSVELVDHTDWLLGAAERRIQISDTLLHNRPALEEHLDSAFATAAATGPMSSSLRARASCLRAVDGRLSRLPDDPNYLWILFAAARGVSFLLARPAVLLLASSEAAQRERLARAIQQRRAASRGADAGADGV